MKDGIFMRVLKYVSDGHYNPNEDSINCCEEKSYVWFHEERHRHQHKNMELQAIISLGWYFLPILTVFTRDWIFSIPIVLTVLYVEIDAYWYGWKNYNTYISNLTKD